MSRTTVRLAPGLFLLGFILLGCDDFGIVPPVPPRVEMFSATPRSVKEEDTVRFAIRVSDDLGLVRGLLNYQDGSFIDTLHFHGFVDSARTSHVYHGGGQFAPTLVVEDVSRVATSDTSYVSVGGRPLPTVSSLLDGVEGASSIRSIKNLVWSVGNDTLTITVSPVSPGLIFAKNVTGDSVHYALIDPNDQGTKQARVVVVDRWNRMVDRTIDVVFAPRDDISGRVFDRFEGSYLATLKPEVVMQGPFTGWVEGTTFGYPDTVRTTISGSGDYTLPKLSVGRHILRAFITNGRDSSFVATYRINSGDQTFGIGVESNAGTGMPLVRLLWFYQTVNFHTRTGSLTDSWLTGMDLKRDPSHYVYYLTGKDTIAAWLAAKHSTVEQQDWMESEILKALVHIPPDHRPRIVKGGPNDVLPLRGGGQFNIPFIPKSGYMLVCANQIATQTDGYITVWDEFFDAVIDCGRIALNGGDIATPPYGFSPLAIMQEVYASISGSGALRDPYYADKSIRAEHTTLTGPSNADMKLDWQVLLQSPGDFDPVQTDHFQLP
jgi:hypothetical protein